MKAIVYRRYGSPDVLRLREVATPTPGPNEILVRVRATSVSAAEMALRKGRPLMTRLFLGLRRPKHQILGFEVAGEVAEVGADVSRFQIGDQVFGATGEESGGDAEFVCLAEDGVVTATPEDLTPQEAVATLEGALTALPFLRDAGGMKAGQAVLVNGASGSVGIAAVQLARHLGAEVTGVTSTKNVELVRSLGADHVVDYTTTDFTRTGRTYDIVFDAVGKSSFGRARRALKPGGTYLSTVIGAGILARMLWTSRIGDRKAKITFTGLRKPADRARDLGLIRQMAEAGELRPVIDRTYPLEQAADAHRYVETGHKTGAVVITA